LGVDINLSAIGLKQINCFLLHPVKQPLKYLGLVTVKQSVDLIPYAASYALFPETMLWRCPENAHLLAFFLNEQSLSAKSPQTEC